MRFLDLLDERHVLTGQTVDSKQEAIRLLVKHLGEQDLVSDTDLALSLVMERENEYPTGIGGGVAIPHANTWQTDRPVLALGLFDQGLDFGSPEGDRATVIILLLTSAEMTSTHLKLLARISRLAKHDLAARLKDQKDPAKVLEVVEACERDFLDI